MEFFRKHQRIVFAIAIIVIVAFSFFGTYTAFSPTSANTPSDEVLFQAVDGTKVRHSQVEEMARFLGSDKEDPSFSNCFNDGVITQDFLASGMAEQLIAKYRDLLAEDFQLRAKKEQNYKPYAHPGARFVNAEAAWGYFAPEIAKNLATLRQTEDPLAPEAVKARIQLFLAQKAFPPALLRQVLQYQESQYSWLAQDPMLPRYDLSLFGYHSMEDWFGRAFLQLVSEFVINASAVAAQQGLKVSIEETIADMVYNVEVAALQRTPKSQGATPSPNEEFSRQLLHLGMTRQAAVGVWQQVLMFRRLFDGLANTVLLDTLAHDNFYAFADETVDTLVYQLPASMRLADFAALQQFEVYLDTIAASRRQDPLSLPEEFLSPLEVAKKAPLLVEKCYLVNVASVPITALTRKVGVKATLEWQLEEKHWSTLQAHHPALPSEALTREARYAALEALDKTTRQAIDLFAKEQIVLHHPEWLQEALQAAPQQEEALYISYDGTKTSLPGITQGKALQELLERVPLKAEALAESPEAKALAAYTQDGKVYYHLEVLKRPQEYQVMTFAKAREEKALQALLQSRLQQYYETLQAQDLAPYQDAAGNAKPFQDVSDRIAALYFKKIVDAIYQDYQEHSAAPETIDPALRGDFCAAFRFLAHMRQAQNALQQGGPTSRYVASTSKETSRLDEQWKLEANNYVSSRGKVGWIENAKLFATIPGEWSPVYTAVSGNVYFFYVKGKEAGSTPVTSHITAAQRSLGNQAKGSLMQDLLVSIGEKGAIALPQQSRHTPENTLAP